MICRQDILDYMKMDTHYIKNNWLNKAKIYHIFIDRFAFPEGCEELNDFAGGSFEGIRKKIPYLKSLGINCVLLSPVYDSDEYHGYHIVDFFKVQKRFGTLEKFKKLLYELKKANIKIILDFVVNHVSYKDPFFLDAMSNKNSKYKNWFYFDKKGNYLKYLDVKELPKLNLDNFETKTYVIDSAKFWLKLGVDSLRLDHVIGPSDKFWIDFNKEIKKNFPNCILIGEALMEGISFSQLKTINMKNKYFIWFFRKNKKFLIKHYVGILDGCLDFGFNDIVRSSIKSNKSDRKIHKKLKKYYSNFDGKFILIPFLSSHDQDRFIFVCDNSFEKFKRGYNFLFKFNGPKIIYYGDESGLKQKKSIISSGYGGDIQVRRNMNWNSIDLNFFNFFKEKLNE